MRKIFFTLFFIFQGALMSTVIDSIIFKNKTIPIIFEYNDKLPIFNMQLIFTNSGYIQDNNISGLRNLTAKILNEGTKTDGAVEFARKLESKAISLNANNGFETFMIEVSSLSEQYIDSLIFLNQLLKEPNITNEALEKIKNLHISKLTQKENDFDYLAKKALMKELFKETKLQNGSSGTIETISKISLEDINQSIKDLFNLDNLIIVVGGQIKKEDFYVDITKTLSILKSKGTSEIEKFDVNKETSQKYIYKDTQQAYIYFGSPFFMQYDDKDAYKSKVASFILGGSGFGSRLMEEIRVKHGLAYSAYGYINTQKSHSYFTGYLQTKLENETKAKDLVIKTIEDFVKNGATSEELDAAKKFLQGSEPLRVETFSQRLGRSFNLYYKNLAQDYPKTELEMIQNLTLEDLNAFIKKHDEINNLTFSIVTKQKEETK
jgi:predicted Zn-dependent peptidase